MYGPYVRLPRPDWPYLGAVRTVRVYGRYVRALRTANADGQPYVRAVRTAERAGRTYGCQKWPTGRMYGPYVRQICTGLKGQRGRSRVNGRLVLRVNISETVRDTSKVTIND